MITAQMEEAAKRRRAILYIVKASKTPVTPEYISHCLSIGKTAPGRSLNNVRAEKDNPRLQRDLSNMRKDGILKKIYFRDANEDTAKPQRVLWVETRNSSKVLFR